MPAGRDLRTARAVAVVGLSVVVWSLVQVLVVRPPLTDLWVYRAEGAALLAGDDLYGPLAGVHGVSTYPPFAALLFVPAALVPTTVLAAASVLGNLALLLVVSWQSVRLAGCGRAGTAPAACVLSAVALWSEPVLMSLSYGQVNLLVLALVLWDLNQRPGSALRGAGIGIAASIKVTPGIFIVYLLLTGRVRAAATAAGTFVAAAAVSALVDGGATWRYWTRHLFDLDRVGRLENSANQSVRGWLVRAHHTRDALPSEALLVLAVLVVGLVCAVLAERRLGDRWGGLAAGVTGLLVSPVSWSHHWVFCVPVVALLWFQARAWVVPALAVFWSYAVWAVPHGHSVELALDGWQVALSGPYVVLGLGFLALTASRARSRPDQTATDGRAGPTTSVGLAGSCESPAIPSV